jgi:sugar phosphate isomerase/epimerase
MPSDRALSLHHLSVMELDPVGLVRVAAAAGFEHVCIFVQGMPGLPFPLVTRANEAAFRAALRETGVGVYNLEIFPLSAEIGPEDYRDSLAFGADLGGTRATALINDADESRAIDQFGRFCEIAQALGVKAGLEFMAFTSVRTLDHAMRIIRGAAHSNGTLALDALHLMRNGVGPADLDRLGVGPDEIGYVQFCDGPPTIDPAMAFAEATANRTVPGEGDFPLGDFLAHLAPGRTLSLECPLDRLRDAGMDAAARAKRLNMASHEVISRFAGAGR